MMLRRLTEYAERLERQALLPPRMYQPTRIRWLIDISRAGGFLGFVRTSSESGARSERRGKEYWAPHVERSSGIRAKLLADRADYALGWVDDDPVSANVKRRARTAQAHLAFRRCVTACAEHTGEPAVIAVRRFLDKLDLARLRVPDDLLSTDVVTFRVDGILPIDLDSVRRYWSCVCDPQAADQTQRRDCIVCGRRRPPAERHPVPIKGVPKGQTSGMQIVSANEAVYESYGLKASLIVPVCHECAERYAQAANALLRSPETHLTIGPLVYLFWTRSPQAFSPVSLLSAPASEEVKQLITAAYSARSASAPNADAFFCTALAASGGRISVHDWMETTVADVQRCLARYFTLQRLAREDGSPDVPVRAFALAAAAARDGGAIEARTIDALVRFALRGGRLPLGLLHQAVQRARVERRVTRPRAALIKMVLASWVSESEGERMYQLDLERDDPAYLCGRLFAVLERAQADAIHAKATIVDRFYGSASVAPQLVFPRLLRGSQSHLAKLRRDKPGLEARLQSQLEDILGQLSQFPAVLSLREQGDFALGYYHQRTRNWRRAGAVDSEIDGSEATSGGNSSDDEKENGDD